MQTPNHRITLNGDWQFAFAPQGERELTAGPWHPCTVPGQAQLDLVRLGIIPDPFYAMNAEAIRDYEHYEWCYRRAFDLPDGLHGKRMELLFHGLDTFAEIWLNGRALGSTANMFIPHRFDVTDILRHDSPNELTVRFLSPLFAAQGRDYSGCFASMGTFESLYVRKARHTYGWDIAPRLLTAGIWRDVELVAHDEYEISDVFVRTARLDGDTATLVFRVSLDLPQRSWRDLSLTIRGQCNTATTTAATAGTHSVRPHSTFQTQTHISSPHIEQTFDIAAARLWWPYGYGEANLYDVEITLFRDGQALHTVYEQIGIRTVALDQSLADEDDLAAAIIDPRRDTADSPVRRFSVLINGVPVFCKGSNAVPMDAFHCRDLERIPAFIEMARDIGCNMLRIWGGGVYEHELFYQLCDRHGIMVMQDFMYACAIYPQDDAFLKIAADEARVVIKTLRNHPSIAVWCGDNEIDLAYQEWYDQSQSPENNHLTRRILKDACQNYDGSRPYMPSSPYSPTTGAHPDSPWEGDRHMYRHGTYYKSQEYLDDRGRFYSEIGHLSLNDEESIRRFIPAAAVWPIDRAVWDYHAGSHMTPYYHMDRIGAIFRAIENMFGKLPTDLADLIQASQIAQAEALKCWIERCRLRKWECSGILWWNLIDCWPQFSDAVVDYYYQKKLAYAYVKIAQLPICLMLTEKEEGDVLTAVLGNDSREEVGGDYKIWDSDSGAALLTGDFLAPANTNTVLGEFTVPGGQHLLLLEWGSGGQTYRSHYLVGRPPFSLDIYKKWLQTSQLPKP